MSDKAVTKPEPVVTTTPRPTPDTPARESLPQALANVFEADLSAEAYATALVRLAAGITLSSDVAVLHLQRGGGAEAHVQAVPLAGSAGADAPLAEVLSACAQQVAEQKGREGVVTEAALGVSIALPTGAPGALVARHPSGGRGAIALAFERLSLLGAASRYRFADPDSDALRQVLAQARALASGEQPEAERFLTLTRALTGAEAAILGWVRDGKVTDIAVAGGQDLAARAGARPDLSATLTEALAGPVTDVHPLGPAGAEPRALLYLPNPRAGTHDLQPIRDTFAAIEHRAKPRMITAARLRNGALVSLLIGAGFVPLPTTVSLPAEVGSTGLRTLTAPVAGVLEEALVANGDQVTLGAPLARFDARQVELSLVQTQAEYADALARRDSARVARDAAEVALQDIELARITAQIARLADQRDSAELRAPITGVVAAPELEARVGSFFFLGGEVLRIADPSALRLDVQIPQTEIAKVDLEAPARFHPDFDPARRFEATLSSISPATDPDTPNARFAAKATLVGDTGSLRLGMRGVLRLEGPARSVWDRVGRAAYRAYRTFVWE